MHTEREMEQICRFTRKVSVVVVRRSERGKEGRRETRREGGSTAEGKERERVEEGNGKKKSFMGERSKKMIELLKGVGERKENRKRVENEWKEEEIM